MQDYRTKSLVIRRVNFGEADRILTLITKLGRLECLAKGVRKEKSKLSGGIELFTLSDVVVHQKSENHLAILTSSRAEKFYSNLLTSLEKIELASIFLKMTDRATKNVSSPDFFELLNSTLAHLNSNTNPILIETFFRLNLAKISGENLNLNFDTNGEKLKINQNYFWNSLSASFEPAISGNFNTTDIKVLRFLLSSDLSTSARLKYQDYDKLLIIAKSVSEL